ncbi:MAG: hypothetical protein ACAH83_13950 [Alphaproteobacteria bacterium]
MEEPFGSGTGPDDGTRVCQPRPQLPQKQPFSFARRLGLGGIAAGFERVAVSSRRPAPPVL